MNTPGHAFFPTGFLRRDFIWRCLFFSTIAAYCLVYAPYGVNETDGGFLTGLAWQVLQGKTLYADIIYVRPPLPVWLRVLELQVLPDAYATLAERWIFYGKIGLSAWLGAAALRTGTPRWILATLAFVVSAHCYQACAWHTVDGIVCAALAAWLLTKERGWAMLLAGGAVVGALLCKQSFYPLAVVFGLALFLQPGWRWRHISLYFCSFFLLSCIFLYKNYANNTLENYIEMTSGAASGGQALEHGVLDYLRINVGLLVLSVVLWGIIILTYRRGKTRLALWAWVIWVLLLMGSYSWQIWHRQEFTIPFAQSRLLFWVAAGSLCLLRDWSVTLRLGVQLAITWCASVSWGYNLPIFYAVPLVFSGMLVFSIVVGKPLFAMRFTTLQHSPQNTLRHAITGWGSVLTFILLVAVFRLGYSFVYRDGPRRAMTVALGPIFPRLSGIYSDTSTAALYQDLRTLSERYPNFKTLPAFPQANFLANLPSPLSLDWVVQREFGHYKTLILSDLADNKPFLLIEKNYLSQIQTDPELALVREIIQTGKVLETTPHFIVMRYE